MADILVDKKAQSLDISEAFDGYSRVVIKTGQTDDEGNDIAYVAGNESGRTLEIENPWGNQEIADNILSKIEGWAYQPMSADSATLNPAFEVGDSVVVNNVFSGIYSSKVRFSRLFTGDIEAPYDKEINHEYQYEDSQERKFTRKLNDAVARLNFYADSIEAKVDKVSEGSTFGWRLDEDSWDVFNQGGTIFSIDAGGAYVKGEIQASSGKIGGFTINNNGLSTNNQTYGGGEQTGVYIGSNGIQLGTRFRVDSQGNLYAGSGSFDGNVYAKNISYGGSAGYFSGGGLSLASIDTSRFVQGIVNSLGFADFSWDVFNNRDTANYLHAKAANIDNDLTASLYYVRGEDEESWGTVNRHTHYGKYENGKITILAPDFTGAQHPFDVAPSADSISLALDGGVNYQSSYNIYAVPVKAVDGNDNVLATETIRFSASAAYSAGRTRGQSEVDVNYSGGSYDIWIDGTQDVYGHRFVQVNVLLTNGVRRTSAWLDAGHI